MHWSDAVRRLREDRLPGVLVTVVAVRGHAPREAGAKLVVGTEATWGSIGGGNLEETAISRARVLVASGAAEPETLVVALSDKVRTEHGRQCCGGEVTLLLEPLPVVPAVAVFGVGHVGLELARILARHDLDLHLVDSRPEQLRRRPAGLPGRCPGDGACPPRPAPRDGAGRSPRGFTRAHPDARPCRGLRPVRRGPALQASGHCRGDRVGGEVAAVPAGAAGGGPHRGRDRPDHLADRGPEVVGKEPATIALAVATALVHAFDGARVRG